MEIYFNELSIHRQFHDIPSFYAAFARLMELRNVARRFGRDVYCGKNLLTADPLPGTSMQQAIGAFPPNERRVAMIWLAKGGPFWDERREHGADDWLECRDDVVTDSAVGEAAYRKLHHVECGLASVKPSDWEHSPIDVVWRQEAEEPGDRTVAVENWWDADVLETYFQKSPPPIASWRELENTSIRRFERLVFSGDCFKPLYPIPFSKSNMDKFLELFGILDRLAGAFDSAGRRTAEARQIFRNYFAGKHAKFSDSSSSEKQNPKFRRKMTFPHPSHQQQTLFCPMHGKITQGTLRFHYFWSNKHDDPIYVVYAGPKITKR